MTHHNDETMRPGIKWGIILGITICVWTLLLHVLGFYTTRLDLGRIADIVATVFPIATIFGAIRERRVRNGGTLTFGEGFGEGMIAGVVSIPLTVGFLWFYHHVINPDWMNLLAAHEESRMRAAGLASDIVAARIDGLRASGSDAAQILGGIIGTTVISLLLSLLFSALLQRKPAASESVPA